MTRAWLMFSLVVLGAGCSSDLTQLVVVVDSDMAIPSELDHVRISVTGPTGLARDAEQVLASSAELPLTLSVVPEGQALGPVRILAIGSQGGREVVRQWASVTLIAGQSRMLQLRLDGSCTSTTCGTTDTCAAGSCRSGAVNTEPWTGRPSRNDAGNDGAIPDAGTDGGDAGTDGGDAGDAGSDAGDAGSDAGDASSDAGSDAGGPACTSAAMCDDGNPCTDDSCVSSRCQNRNNTAACDDGLFCTAADTCGGGACQPGSGSPCAGVQVCAESMSSCVDCLLNSDCPGATVFCLGNACVPADCDGACSTGMDCETGVLDCSGSIPTCLHGDFEPSTTICGSSDGECDPAEYCTGTSAACPSNVRLPLGTSCMGGAARCDDRGVCCDGCVQDGECRSSTSRSRCGRGGVTCFSCAGTEVCSSAGACVECDTAIHCSGHPGGPKCVANVCVPCDIDSDCFGVAPGGIAICDTSTMPHRCIGCVSDADCGGRTDTCVTGRCVECVTTADCTAPATCMFDLCV